VPTSRKCDLLTLVEWETRTFRDLSLSPTDRQLATQLSRGEDGRLVIDELRDGMRISARSWVGVVRFENIEIQVVPKLAGGNFGLVEMIEFATGLDALRRNAGIRSLDAQDMSLLDLIALLLAEACELIIRDGILADYVEHEEELPAVRGRFLADRQILRRHGQIDRLVCRYDELEHNVLENQILAAALRVCGKRITHPATKRRVRQAQAIFEEVCEPDLLNFEQARQQITYHRLNEHYHDAHALAWLIFDMLGIKDLLASGEVNSFAFLIDMNQIFERFIYRLVDRLLDPTVYDVRYQHADRSILWDASANRSYTGVIPDLIVERRDNPQARLAIDAKYKLYDERKVATGDIYQSFLYAYAYAGQHDLPAALLLYPSTSQTCQALHVQVRGVQRHVGAEIMALGVAIPESLREIKGGQGGIVTNTIREVVQRFMRDLSVAVPAG
jgi:5-methylcytosine-specific restriction enzyme subunit McrC